MVLDVGLTQFGLLWTRRRAGVVAFLVFVVLG